MYDPAGSPFLDPVDDTIMTEILGHARAEQFKTEHPGVTDVPETLSRDEEPRMNEEYAASSQEVNHESVPPRPDLMIMDEYTANPFPVLTEVQRREAKQRRRAD